MRKSLLAVYISFVFSHSLFAQGHTSRPILDMPRAGVDYPTDAPFPLRLEHKQLLELKTHKRILVPAYAQLVEPEAGVDFPTDSPIPSRLIDTKILVLLDHVRIPIVIKQAVAGIDFPTEMNANFDVWEFSKELRVNTRQIISLEEAIAGVDYPTDAPNRFASYVLVTIDAAYRLHRTPLNLH